MQKRVFSLPFTSGRHRPRLDLTRRGLNALLAKIDLKRLAPAA